MVWLQVVCNYYASSEALIRHTSHVIHIFPGWMNASFINDKEDPEETSGALHFSGGDNSEQKQSVLIHFNLLVALLCKDYMAQKYWANGIFIFNVLL